MTKANKGRGYVYYLHDHIVWCVKYRHQVIHSTVEDDLKETLQDIAKEKDGSILKMETDKDHVHLLIDCKPQHSIPSLLKSLKSVSARRLFLKHPELKKKLWGGHLWNPSYFVATASENTEKQIKHYIQNQQINWK